MPLIRANGLDIEYESFGREGDPAILLIMGFDNAFAGPSAASLFGANSHRCARPRRSHSLLRAFSTRATKAFRCVSLATLRW